MENLTIVILCFNFLSFQIDNLSQEVHRVRSSENFPEYFTRCLLQLMFQVLYRHVCGVTLLLHLLLDHDSVLLYWLVLALLFQDLCVRPICWVLACCDLSLTQFNLLLGVRGLLLGLRVQSLDWLILGIGLQNALLDFSRGM